MSKDKVQKWVEVILKNEELVDYTIDVQGKTNKDDCYLGDITFLTVAGKTKSGVNKTMNLVIKSSKESDKFRKQFPIREAFEMEIFIYDKVKTAFLNFQKEKGLQKLVEVTPYCYATQATGTSEFLVLENVKLKGFKLWDRKIPMDFDHVRIILETYGKWHALSLALKNQRPEVFEQLAQNKTNTLGEFTLKAKVFDFLWEKFEESKETLLATRDEEALKKLQFNKSDGEYIVSGLLHEDPKHQVILHGDCWTNNYMFQYDKNSSKPSAAVLIDWQMAALGSPIVDLSYFLYCCCAYEDCQNLEILLKFYYDSLAEQLKELGSDPEEVFSFETLVNHWKRFSKFGIVISPFILRFSLCENDDAPDLAEVAEQGDDFAKSFYFTLKDENKYLERVKHNLLHYVQNV